MALRKALRDKPPTLLHNPSNESLFVDLTQVATAPAAIISKTIFYRDPAEREEISRILGHLPMIRQARANRRKHKSVTPRGGVAGGQNPEGLSVAPAPRSARSEIVQPQLQQSQNAAPGGPSRAAGTPRQPPSGGKEATLATRGPPAVPQKAWTADAPRASSAMGTPRRHVDLAEQDAPSRSATPRADLPPRAATSMGHHPQEALPPRAATSMGHHPQDALPPRAATSMGINSGSPVRASTPRQATPRASPNPPATPRKVAANTGSAEKMAPERSSKDADWYKASAKIAAGGARLGFAGMPLDDEVPKLNEQAMEELKQRNLDKMAEVGIDPDGMTASDILRLLYARKGGSSYKLMNEEAEKKLTVRVKTPLCVPTVLREQAVQEVKNARDMPTHFVHDCLDKWEIETLAEVCRSMKHFDEEFAGQRSHYTTQFSARDWLGKFNRKKYVRPPTR
eukprot:TRINITY_DN77330_c0_g1_i1.p1 TRINITY_DN77330_c0_g1~~TRINITY_DN77330_c0_g1_i1.p1  ORF type:complete len:483 (+),score=90.29 TRINITY_DN77330_c0_g1_i1:89-1450(+)